jgi:hypothetical protein
MDFRMHGATIKIRLGVFGNRVLSVVLGHKGQGATGD